MRRFQFLTVAAAVALLSAAAVAQAVQYEIDPVHSSAQFSVRHLMISNVRGEFAKVTGTVVYDPKNVEASSVEATIDATTINTHEPKRDDHLKSPDFFDVAKYPTLSFKSKRVEKAGGGKLRVTGDLTIHGVTKEVVLDVEGPSPEQKAGPTIKSGASATTTVNRKDFGLVWNRALESGGVLVGDEIKITLEIEMGRKVAASTPQPLARDGQVSHLRLSTQPGGVQVYVDQTFKGVSSEQEGELRIENVTPGSHRLRLTLPGYKEWNQQVRLAAGEVLPVTAKLEQAGPKPLGFEEVEEALKNGVSSKRVAVFVKQFGVDFGVNPEREERLRAAGADAELLYLITQSRK